MTMGGGGASTNIVTDEENRGKIRKRGESQCRRDGELEGAVNNNAEDLGQ